MSFIEQLDKFLKDNPLWDQFKMLPGLKDLFYKFLPIAEKMAMDFDKNDTFLAYLDSLMNALRDKCKELNRDNDRILRPVQKISLGIFQADPAYRNYAIALIGMIRYGKEPPLTPKMKAWLKARYGLEIP